MEQTGYYSPDELRKLTEAFEITKKAFPNEEPKILLELLDICLKNQGLYVAPAAGMVMGFFRYNPRLRIGERTLLDTVKDYDYETLKLLDLSDGEVVHIVGFASNKGDGYRIVRKFIKALNPRAVSTHRFRDGVRYFCCRKNVRKADA